MQNKVLCVTHIWQLMPMITKGLSNNDKTKKKQKIKQKKPHMLKYIRLSRSGGHISMLNDKWNFWHIHFIYATK